MRKGERVRLVVTSEDVDHGFALKEFDIDQELKAKQTKAIEFTPNREGRFQFSCSVFCGDGHNDMAGELIVTEAPIEAASTMKLSFDQTRPGVLIVESAGERLRIDTAKKTVERIAAAGPAKSRSSSREQAPVATKERESSKAYEPYDYHVVNIPTPKQVRRHSLNLFLLNAFRRQLLRSKVKKQIST